jgi:hypothetical protein
MSGVQELNITINMGYRSMTDLQALGWYVVENKTRNTNNPYETCSLLHLQCAVFTSGNAAWFMLMKKCMISTVSLINQYAHQYNIVSVLIHIFQGFYCKYFLYYMESEFSK